MGKVQGNSSSEFDESRILKAKEYEVRGYF